MSDEMKDIIYAIVLSVGVAGAIAILAAVVYVIVSA